MAFDQKFLNMIIKQAKQTKQATGIMPNILEIGIDVAKKFKVRPGRYKLINGKLIFEEPDFMDAT